MNILRALLGPGTGPVRLALLGAALLPAGPARAQTPAAPPPVLATGTPAAPVPPGPWTLQAAVAYAVAHNLDVGQAVLSARTSRTYLQQSKAALLPTANLNGTQVWNYGTNVNPLTYEFQSQTIRSNNLSAVSQLVLYQGFQLRNTVKRNALDYAATLGDIEKARNDLSLNVASQYLQLLLAEELIRANQTRVASSQAQVDRTQILLRAGSVAESNLLDSQSQLASDELNVVTATNQRDIARLSLTQLLNLPPAAAAAFVADVPALPDPDEEALLALNVEDTYQTAAARLPEIRAAELRVQSAGRSLDLARGGYYPSLALLGAVRTGYSSSATSRQITGDSSVTALPVYQYNPANPARPTMTNLAAIIAQPSYAYLPKGFFSQLNDNLGRTIQFSLNVPVLNGLQVRNNVQRALISEDVARLRADQARLTLRQSIEQANADARAAQLQYIFAKRQVAALTTSQRNAEIRFNNGLLNGTDFNIAKNNLTAAESNRLQAKYTFIFRRKVLDFYLGKPLAL